MRTFSKTVLSVIVATIWISISEFVRNEILIKSYWVNHYKGLGLILPSDSINGIIWGIWSLLFAILIFIVSKKFSLIQQLLFVGSQVLF